MSEYQKESQLLLLLDYFKQNPGTTLSIAYMLLTLCGILYSQGFYEEFNIEILKLANVSDLMIIGVSEPAAILMFGGGLLVAYFTDFITRRSYDAQRRWREKPKSFKRRLILTAVYTPKKSISVMFIFVCTFVVYSYIFMTLYADWKSKQVKRGKGKQVILELVETNKLRTVTLLGSTTNFILTYHPDSKQANVYPVDQIKSIVPAAKPSEQ
ncbi:hypothetical protein [Aliiglaciecola sp. M165]|uniref:hypothetical protein n=1 Tax=Aliiglaciecola sp. M165 TaxID=2593649 RepID=UPI00117E7EA2|nr:hypothetical protein [Aliiglaciecola sp. M165]TRY33717.1 hypothetical protein FM019_00190 [Aliiglaciecola sp. M165]